LIIIIQKDFTFFLFLNTEDYSLDRVDENKILEKGNFKGLTKQIFQKRDYGGRS